MRRGGAATVTRCIGALRVRPRQQSAWRVSIRGVDHMHRSCCCSRLARRLQWACRRDQVWADRGTVQHPSIHARRQPEPFKQAAGVRVRRRQHAGRSGFQWRVRINSSGHTRTASLIGRLLANVRLSTLHFDSRKVMTNQRQRGLDCFLFQQLEQPGTSLLIQVASNPLSCPNTRIHPAAVKIDGEVSSSSIDRVAARWHQVVEESRPFTGRHTINDISPRTNAPKTPNAQRLVSLAFPLVSKCLCHLHQSLALLIDTHVRYLDAQAYADPWHRGSHRLQRPKRATSAAAAAPLRWHLSTAHGRARDHLPPAAAQHSRRRTC
jgi:hypothetical protein